jgi:putative methyltransferase
MITLIPTKHKKLLERNVRVAFINPPHADWSLANNAAYLMFQSHYKRYGKYPDKIEWLKAPYKFNRYETVQDIYEDGIQNADIYLFSSYVWNYEIIDELAEYVKKINPNSLCVVGGPHIGTNDKKFLESRKNYDFILTATKPGEIFVEDFLNEYIETLGNPNYENISWELRSKKTCPQMMPNYSVYEDHLDFLKETREYVRQENLEPFAIIETTRGCPYKCSFCEWGGGIGSKVYKKPLEIVKADIIALKEAGFRDVYLTDANYGAFLERDLEIFKFAWENKVNLTDISTMKSKSLERRTQLIDAWFNIVGSNADIKENYISFVPTVSIQSISDEAMKVANRVDLSFSDKIKLSEHIKKRCQEEGYPIPALELILGMPGSTLSDFYEEMEILWNFKAWTSQRHDYMFLPDSELSKQEYLKKYDIKLVEVYTDLVDEDGVDNINGLYKNKKHTFNTISSCYSYTNDELCEMWIMNLSGNWLLQNLYENFFMNCSPSNFSKMCWHVLNTLNEFDDIWQEVKDILNPNSPPKNIKRLQGKLRNTVILDLLEKNKKIIFNELFKETYVSNGTYN